MDVVEAVHSLASPDLDARELALDVSRKFQTPPFFSWGSLMELVRGDTAAKVFALTTLTQLVDRFWHQLPKETKDSISDAFPFTFDFDLSKDVFRQSASRAAAVYLTRTTLGDQAYHAFVALEKFPNHFAADVLTEFICCFHMNGEINRQLRRFLKFMRGGVPLLFTNLIMRQLDTDPSLIRNIATIHIEAPQLVKLFCQISANGVIYTRLASELWTTKDFHATEIFSAIFSTQASSPELVSFMIEKADEQFVQAHSNLQSLGKSIDIQGDIDIFNQQMGLLFSIYAVADVSELGSVFNIVRAFLRSPFHEVVSLSAEHLAAFMRRCESEEFFGQYSDEWLDTLSICIMNLAAAADKKSCMPIFALCKAIGSKCGTPRIVKFLSSMVLSGTLEEKLAITVVRVYSAILSSIQDDVPSDTKLLITSCAAHLINSIQAVPVKEQSRLVTFLINSIPYLVEVDDQALFLCLLQVLSSPSVDTESFRNFVFAFVAANSSALTFPSDLIGSLGPDSALFWMYTGVVYRLEGMDNEKITEGIELAMQIIRGSGNFQTIVNAIHFLAIIDYAPITTDDITAALVNCLIDLTNSFVQGLVGNSMTMSDRAYSHIFACVGKVLRRMKETGVPVLQVVPLLEFPLRLLDCVHTWFSSILIPLLDENEEEAISSYLEKDIPSFVQFVGEIASDGDSADVNQDVFCRIAYWIASLAKYVTLELGVPLLSSCLLVNDGGVYRRVVEVLRKGNLGSLQALWDLLTSNAHPIWPDEMAGLVLLYVKEEKMTFEDIGTLNGIDQKSYQVMLNELQKSSNQSTQSKQIRRCFEVTAQMKKLSQRN